MRLFISFCMIICLSFLSLVAEAVIIEAKRANVRSSPGTSSEILFVYRQNAPLEVLETQENWIKVRDFEKDIGWVSKKVISEGQRGAIMQMFGKAPVGITRLSLLQGMALPSVF